MNTQRKTPRKPDRKFVEYPRVSVYLNNPDHLLMALPSATKRAWLRALRSGDYTQAIGGLRKKRFLARSNDICDGFCCLGVLADIIDTKAWTKVGSDQDYWYSWYDRTGLLPTKEEGKISAKLVQVMNQPLRNDDSIPETVMNALYRANDYGTSFEQIALWIERYL